MPTAKKQGLAAYDRLPLSFVPNEGQLDGRVRYSAQARGASFSFTKRNAVFSLTKKKQGLALRLGFLDSNPRARIVAQKPQSGRVNYLIGHDPAGWRTNLPTYGELVYRDLWPGIDLVFRGAQGQLKYELHVDPGASLEQVRLAYRGASGLSVDRRGNLKIKTALGTLRDSRPVSYQRLNGRRVPVSSRFLLGTTGGTYGFAVGAYDHSRPLVVDPTIFYSTLLSGPVDDYAYGIAVDGAGSAYVSGYTFSSNYPTSTGAFDTSQNGDYDAFVTKLDPTGAALGYSTYLGGSARDQGSGITVDGAGSAYLTGHTLSANFPTTAGAFDTSSNGSYDGFVTKLDAAGAALGYSTYLGGSSTDFAQRVAVDGAGSAYVSGSTSSTDFPTTAGAFDTSFNSGTTDAFVAKLNMAGSTLGYSTYLGGSLSDSGGGIALDGAGSAYVTGSTSSVNFPTSAGAFDTSHNGGTDAFVTKLDAAGAALGYSTYLGGTGGSSGDSAAGIALDGAGNAYVAGTTISANFPTTAGAFDTSWNGDQDAFVTKLDAAGAALGYSTFLGGSSADQGVGPVLDAAGSVYITGHTQSANFPTSAGAFDTSYNGGFGDPYVTKLNAAGAALDYSTYLGGSAIEYAAGIAVDGAGSAYVAGFTESTNFPTTAGAFDTSSNGFYDGFATKLDAAGSSLTYSTYLGGSDDDAGQGVALDGAGSAYVTGYTDALRFPTTAGALDTSWNGGVDVFITKLNAAGTALLYSTYLGGSADDYGSEIAVDGGGSAYVTGYSGSANFPTTAGAFDTSSNGGDEAFVAKLNATGSALLYSTYLGAGGADYGSEIAVDGAGSAYLTGLTDSTNFPTTAGAYDTSYNGSVADAFVTKLDAAGSSLVYSTYLGGGASDNGSGIAIDGAGSAYVTGATSSSDFPVTAGAFDTSHNGQADVFVTKLDAAGAALGYSTFVGGGSGDRGAKLAVGSAGSAYVTGFTTSPDFPATAGAFDTTHNGFRDAFVTKLDPAGAALGYSTYLGGSINDQGSGIAVDSTGGAYVTGFTESANFPTAGSAFDTSSNGGFDVFVTKLDGAGASLGYSTYLGGSADDSGQGIAVDGASMSYVTGYTASANFPSTTYDTTYDGGLDAFVTKLNTRVRPTFVAPPPPPALRAAR